MIKTNAVRVVEVSKHEWEVQMRPTVHWTTPNGWVTAHKAKGRSACVEFVCMWMHES